MQKIETHKPEKEGHLEQSAEDKQDQPKKPNAKGEKVNAQCNFAKELNIIRKQRKKS